MPSHAPSLPTTAGVRLKLRLPAGSGPDGGGAGGWFLVCTKLRSNVMATACHDCLVVCTRVLMCVHTWRRVFTCFCSVHLHVCPWRVSVCTRAVCPNHTRACRQGWLLAPAAGLCRAPGDPGDYDLFLCSQGSVSHHCPQECAVGEMSSWPRAPSWPPVLMSIKGARRLVGRKPSPP